MNFMLKSIWKIKDAVFFSVLCFILISCNNRKTPADLPQSPNALMKEIKWSDITWTDGFWADKIDLCNREIIPAVEKGFMTPENSEHLVNLKIAAGMAEGEFKSLDWSDGDNYKWIESMALIYAINRDPKLDSLMDYWINVIAKAQEQDGYISTNMQLKKIKKYEPAGSKKPHKGAYHEMYNMGHLLTAATVHFRATGKRNFLDIAIKVADHLERTFKPGAPELQMMMGNLPNIMGLVDMYKVTGDKRYLVAAQIPVDIRGHMPDTNDFTQDFVPFREEDQAVGHSVFATYLYSGVADIYAETGEKALLDALDRIWRNATGRRTYITGGCAAFHSGISARGSRVGEAFGPDYYLPNRTAYNETCANIGSAMWNFRMAMITGDAKYTDMVETVMYNSMLSAVGTDGQGFFYANPLECNFNKEGHNWHHTEQRWGSVHPCYCCPPQVSRAIAGIGRWAYGVADGKVWIHQFGNNNVETSMPCGSVVSLKQESEYPWNGEVKITVEEMPESESSVLVRIPGWVEDASLRINKEPYSGSITPGTYLELKRQWKQGDVIELNLPMPVRIMKANPLVEDCRSKLAVMRGPVVYCAEFPVDKNGKEIWEKGVFLPENAEFSTEKWDDQLGGVVVLKGKALTSEERNTYLKNNKIEQTGADTLWAGTLYKKVNPGQFPGPSRASVDLTLVPYFAWENRGPAYMMVWIPAL